jgi:hypothetical protein
VGVNGVCRALEDADLWGYADQLGLDRRRLAPAWTAAGCGSGSALESGARGTPTLFINGRLHPDGYDEAALGTGLATAIRER